jgi:hypothetical protein
MVVILCPKHSVAPPSLTEFWPILCCLHAIQVRCKTGAVFNNGRPLRISDLPSYRPYDIKDNAGRDWPGELQAYLATKMMRRTQQVAGTLLLTGMC